MPEQREADGEGEIKMESTQSTASPRLLTPAVTTPASKNLLRRHLLF